MEDGSHANTDSKLDLSLCITRETSNSSLGEGWFTNVVLRHANIDSKLDLSICCK